MIDDLVTRGVSEPYRMFTSRAEFRLRLRADNADLRLTPLGESLGCIGHQRRQAFAARKDALTAARATLDALALTPNEAARHGLEVNRDGRRRSAFDLLSLPDVDIERLSRIWPQLAGIPSATASQIETDARYAAYVDRQEADVAILRRDEATEIPPDFNYAAISGLSVELRQKLSARRPLTLAHAARIDGITPAALMLILAHTRKPQRRSA